MFVTPTEKNNYSFSLATEIHSITGTNMNSQLGNALTNRFAITKISSLNLT